MVNRLHPWLGSDGEPIRWLTVADDPGVAELAERYQTRNGLVKAFAEQSGLGGNPDELDAGTAAGLVEVLGRSTTTPDEVFVAVWEFAAGDTGLIGRLQQDPRLEVVETTFDAPANHAAIGR